MGTSVASIIIPQDYFFIEHLRRRNSESIMARKKYVVELTDEDRAELTDLLSAGEDRTRKLTRARILLKADEGWTGTEISDALDSSPATVQRTRTRFSEDGLAALNRRKSDRVYEHKLDGAAEARPGALVCSTPPMGHARLMLRLLAGELVKLDEIAVLNNGLIG